MTSVLEYKKYGLKFYCICPKSSGTIEKQERTYNPWGVAVVAFLEEEQKKDSSKLLGHFRVFNIVLEEYKICILLCYLFLMTSRKSADH